VKLQDVHKESFEKEIFRLKKIDLDALLARGPFMPNVCPACKSAVAQPKYLKDGFQYQECSLCETVFMSPVPTGEAKEWYLENSLYLRYWRENMPAEVRESRNRELYRKRAASIAEIAAKYGVSFRRILEIGGGMGEMSVFIDEVMNYEEYLIVEPQPIISPYPKVRVINSTIENLDLSGQADLVLAYELIEHIVDPDILLEKVIENLSPGGLFILSTPGSGGYDFTILGEKARAVGYDHVSLYNVDSLSLLLKRHGFEIIEISTPGSLDIPMIKLAWDNGEFQTDDTELIALLEGDEQQREAFQAQLRESKRSSHLICIARKN
jgi:SAM-dependent methyltransferase